MKNRSVFVESDGVVLRRRELPGKEKFNNDVIKSFDKKHRSNTETKNVVTEILFITSFPPRECGIATYSQDLITAINTKFSNSIAVTVCALESGEEDFDYSDEVKYVLKTSFSGEYKKLSSKINRDPLIEIVIVQHEFGFYRMQEGAFQQFLKDVKKPVVMVFHTVLPHPDEQLKEKVKRIAAASRSIIVMTHLSAEILMADYDIPGRKISVIAHGSHLVPHLSEAFLKQKYGLSGRKVLTTFGLLSSGKSIETALEALREIIITSPEIIFLIIGKTHPEVVKNEGEKYRELLQQKVMEYALHDHVCFINKYLPLPILLEYLQLTDIYLFTTNDPYQAVSGTFVYAMSCACPIISTPIPHAREVLTKDRGIIFDFRNSQQLSEGIKRLLNDEPLRRHISSNTLQKIVSTNWENSAVAHAMLFEKIAGGKLQLQYNLPVINLDHVKKMTTDVGIIQFSKINQPDPDSGYTLDDNARALVAMCMYLKLSGDPEIIDYIRRFYSFIEKCHQTSGSFLNYVGMDGEFTGQNTKTNLDDANGRAVWALGYLSLVSDLLPRELVLQSRKLLNKSLNNIGMMRSTRAMAFAIKGLYYSYSTTGSNEQLEQIVKLSNRLVQMYKHERDEKWEWFESYLTYANSILPEAMLYAWLLTGENIYKDIARTTLHFLLSQTFNESGIEVISNKNWLYKGKTPGHFGEQPIDVSYTIMTLSKFYEEFKDEDYRLKLQTAFNWFLGKNRLHQIIYNPCTGGCYDGLEETHVNLNQGAESTISYLMARLTMENYRNLEQP